MVRKYLFLAFFLSTVAHADSIRLGIDVLRDDSFGILAGKKVGLVVHPASVNSEMVSTVEVFRQTDRCKLVALFGPEHGVYGDEYAGIPVGDRMDSHTGLPVRSLYGKNRKPTPEMLKGLDALVFDLQDIGSRSYTYISTMKLCLEACAEAGIEFVVLDRPNPLGGKRIEGPMLEKGFESFIGELPVPYLHGMTMGELAQLVKEDKFPHYQKLHVIMMSGWKRSMMWDDTGLRWVPTSPHIPLASTCAAYAATGILGELGQLSNGVGYPQPFELVGAPWIRAESLAEALNRHWQNPEVYSHSLKNEFQPPQVSPCPKGVQFRQARYKPFYGTFKDQGCEGVQVYLSPRGAETLIEINFRVLVALDAPKLFHQAAREEIRMFDQACGTDEPRKWLTEERDPGMLFERWKTVCSKFRETRQKFLSYD